jgi:phosphatidylserine/phosphatidylglycerophosphate/cardiolipin synthase-like enzyme
VKRRIHRAAGSTSNQVADALQSVLAAELLAPSRCIWLISPWVSDAVILDNSAGGFVALEPSWGYRGVRLSELLGRLASLGSHIVLATRPDSLNDHFIASLNDQAGSLGVPERITIHRENEGELHEKGMLTDRCYLAGSMNFTYRGITVNEEVLTLSSDPEDLATVRLTYHRRWGGQL